MSTTYTRDLTVSWEELHRHARSLAWRLLDAGPWRGIVSITRGGMVPAAIIARELELRLVDTVCVSSYAHQRQGELTILKHATVPRDEGKGWLLVDDLVDTGRTVQACREKLPQAHVATLFAKPEGRPFVDTFIEEVPQDTWILFPWDARPSFASPLVDRGK